MDFLTVAKKVVTRWWSVAYESWLGYRYGRRWCNGFPPFPLGARPAKTELEEYFDSHETGPGIAKFRHYFPIYDRHLSKLRGREVHILEVGVLSGGSLYMWSEYFGEDAHVYGVDINEQCRRCERPGVRVFTGDQADPKFWRRFLAEVPMLDIVIDDGGHHSFQQRATLEALLPHIRPGGIYLCEDVTPFNPFLDYVHNLSRNLHMCAGYPGTSGPEGGQPTEFQQAVDSIHVYPFVVVVEKRSEPLERMVSENHGTEWPSTWPRA